MIVVFPFVPVIPIHFIFFSGLENNTLLIWLNAFLTSATIITVTFLLADETFLSVVEAIPDAKIIIVTAPHKISGDRAKKMINFFRKEQIPIFGWIENMRGFLCQNCDKRQELFSTGPGSRAVFLLGIPFLGRIPIDPHMGVCTDAGDLFLEKHPESEVAEACNLIIEKIIGGNKANLSEDRSTGYDSTYC